jgi:hypothetical protein
MVVLILCLARLFSSFAAVIILLSELNEEVFMVVAERYAHKVILANLVQGVAVFLCATILFIRREYHLAFAFGFTAGTAVIDLIFYLQCPSKLDEEAISSLDALLVSQTGPKSLLTRLYLQNRRQNPP